MDELLRTWNGLSFAERRLVLDAGIIIGALIVGKIVGAAVQSALAAKGCDAILTGEAGADRKEHWSSRDQRSAPRGFTPSTVFGYLCAATVWGAGAWGVATLHHCPVVADAVSRLSGKVWALAMMVALALVVGGWIDRRLRSLLGHAAVTGIIERATDPQTLPATEIVDLASHLLQMCIYGLVCVLAIMACADMLEMPGVSGAIGGFWQLGLRLIAASAALGIGWLGLMMTRRELTRDLEAGGSGVPSTVNAGLVLIVGVALIAITLLAPSSGALTELFIILLVAVMLWPLYPYLPDLWAGFLLRIQHVAKVRVGDVVMQVTSVGPLLTELSHDDQAEEWRNHEVLQAKLAGPHSGRVR